MRSFGAVFTSICFFAVIFPLVSFAQFGSSQLRIDSNIQSPSPFSDVTLTVNDYSLGAFGAEIRWYVDGVLVNEANNQRSLVHTVGDLGETSVVRLDLIEESGNIISTSRSFTPVRIDIITEAQTYVPSFYKGAPLPSKQSIVRFTALLFSNNTIPDQDLVYTWTVDNELVGTGGSINNSTVEVPISFRQNQNVQVSISQRDGTRVGSKSIPIPVVSPEIMFYQVSTLNDISPLAITSGVSLIGNEITLRAQPYHLDLRSIGKVGITEWELRNRPLFGSGYEITLNRSQIESASRLDFSVQDSDILMQRAAGNITIN